MSLPPSTSQASHFFLVDTPSASPPDQFASYLDEIASYQRWYIHRGPHPWDLIYLPHPLRQIRVVRNSLPGTFE